MAPFFYREYAEVRKDDIEDKVSKYLIDHPSDSYEVRMFTDKYLKPLQGKRREDRKADGRIEIENPGLNIWTAFMPAQPNPYVEDPTAYLDALLQDVMKTGRATLPIPVPVAFGFSGCGWGFYRKLMKTDRQWLLSSDVAFPGHLTEFTPYGQLRWLRLPEDANEQMWHFVFFLRQTMLYLAENPVGTKTVMSTSDLAHMLTQLPRAMVFIRSGNDVGQLRTHEPQKSMMEVRYLNQRAKELRDQTRQRYAKPKSEVEARPAPAPDTTLAPQPKSRWEDVK